MTHRPVLYVALVAILSPMAAFSGCGSSATTTMPITTGGGGSGGSTGAGGTTGSGAGGSTTGAGGSSTGAGGSAMCAPSPDATCNTSAAKTGAACTVDCCVTCGFNGIGQKICTCSGGAFSACPCPVPATYMGAPTAPYCTTPDGMTAGLKNMPCTTEWEECVGKDPVSGTTPQGCVCMNNPTTNALQWYCGSTNKWFLLQ